MGFGNEDVDIFGGCYSASCTHPGLCILPSILMELVPAFHQALDSVLPSFSVALLPLDHSHRLQVVVSPSGKRGDKTTLDLRYR